MEINEITAGPIATTKTPGRKHRTSGLAGDEIPLESRIITVADIFDALTTVRPYKDAWPIDQALAELKRMAKAGKIDPDLLDALEDNIDEAILVRDTYLEEQAVRGA